jgi:anti-sigma factor RsiW
MSDPHRTTHRRDCGGDVAAYALGALEDSEAEAFRRHLETCTVCQEELRSFREVVDELPLSAPRHAAPAAVRRKVMREVRADARARRHAGATDTSARRGGGAAPGLPRTRRAGWLVSRPGLALGVALLVAVGVAVAVISGSSSSPRARVISARVVGPGTAQLHVSAGRASLVVRRFAQPPAGKIYEIWLVRGTHAPVPANQLFSVSSAGNAVVPVPGDIKGVSTVLVTPERMGGSPHPTHAPVISVSLD